MAKKLIGTIDLTPNYEVTAEAFARMLADHEFQQGAYDPVISLIEQVRYLDRKDINAETPLAETAVEKILVKLRAASVARGHRRSA